MCCEDSKAAARMIEISEQTLWFGIKHCESDQDTTPDGNAPQTTVTCSTGTLA